VQHWARKRPAEGVRAEGHARKTAFMTGAGAGKRARGEAGAGDDARKTALQLLRDRRRALHLPVADTSARR
jgi:hypothetical protein